ncbi:MAG TPA: T9SS type A sorting domain-containing protein [Bacteroidetes bacterium]|nr:T9SS type A sorting domain-containing protein [Bacteroidota bacterium]
MKHIIILILLFQLGHIYCQNKQDYVWLFGLKDNDFAQGNQSYRFDFKIKPFKIPVTDNGIGFDNNNASICDKNGNLLFYSNGCAVLNKDAEIMPNGDSINEDIWKKITGWDMCEYGYPGIQDIIILDDPGNEENNKKDYYIIHKTIVFNGFGKDDSNHLRCTIVDMDLDGGLGDVTIKDSTFYKEKQVLSSYLTAIRHQNGKDWWIVQPMEDTNVYLTFLLDENGIELKKEQAIGKVFDWNASSSGTARFSPDGTKYAYYNESDGLLLFDFDRSNGLLANYKRVVPFDTTGIGIYCSVEWSPNSRFVYTATETKLHQIDTWEEDLQDGVRLIDIYDGTRNPFPNTFFLMAQGPDCRIYMCSTSGNKTYHVINHPNRLGKDCDFVQNGIVLPYEAGFGSMPNFPRFRVDEADKCDSTIVSVFGDYVYYRRDLTVYPNPSSGIFNVKIPDRLGKGKLVVTDIQGQIIYKKSISGILPGQRINITGMPTGRYNIDVYPDKNPKRIVYGVQVVKVSEP